jgi:hypothetical protein
MTEEDFDLPNYLECGFPALAWPGFPLKWGGVFHHSPLAIRFNLGGTPTGSRLRAGALYEAAFLPTDVCVVAEAHFIPLEGGGAPREGLFAFSAKHRIGLRAEPQRREWQTDEGPPGDEGAKGTLMLAWVAQPARSFDYARIIEGIANADHALEPSLHSRVYVLAAEKGLLFHMYDDRGLDMAAQDRATLGPLYRQFGDWLLDHDRPRMEMMFKDMPGSVGGA